MDLGSLGGIIQILRLHKIKIPEPVLANIVGQILRGLYYLHKKLHQMHRDLKPDNILISRLGEIKLTDFGISKAMESTFGLCATFVGTPSYMSPERIQGTKYSFPSDVWSLGIIIYEMVTGCYPYSLKTSVVELYEHIVNTPEPKLDSGSGYSDRLRHFLSCWYLTLSN